MNIKKLLIFGTLGLALAAGAGAGALYLLPLIKGGGEHTDAEEEQKQEESQAEVATPPASKPAPPPQMPSYVEEEADDETGVKLAANQTHIINLPTSQGGSRNVYLKVQISIIVTDEELGNAMKSPTPTYESEKSKSIVREALIELSAEEINDPETQIVFVQDIKDKLNEQFRPRPGTPEKADKGKKEHNKEDKNAAPRPLRPIKEVLIIEWQIQR